MRIQNSTKFNLGSLVQLCQVTALFSSSWHFGILVLFPIPCRDLLLYTHTCPFSFRTLMSDRSLHVERLQDGDIPPWVSFTINIVPPWVGKWGWDSVVCDWLIFFFLLVFFEAPAAGRHWLLQKLFVFVTVTCFWRVWRPGFSGRWAAEQCFYSVTQTCLKVGQPKQSYIQIISS